MVNHGFYFLAMQRQTKPTSSIFYNRFFFPLKTTTVSLHTATKSRSFIDSAKTRNKASKFLVYCNTQITQNGRNGNIEAAESIFNRMPFKSTVSWTAMLTAYADNGKISKAREVFDEMPERTTSSYNAMITAYNKNGCMVDEAYKLFCNMSERNAVSYGAMITGFVNKGRFDKALEIYENTPGKWREPVCSNVLINGYLKFGRLDEAVGISEGMIERDVVSWSLMVDGYCKSGRLVEARKLFDKMVERNVVTWTTMINGYMKMGNLIDGFGLFSSMRKESGVLVNSTTLSIMVEACGNFNRYREGIQMQGLVLRFGFEFDVFLGNSIITMYCRFGCIYAANLVFNMMRKKDLVSWNSLIMGYVQENEIEEAYDLFEKMPKRDVVSWTTMIMGFSSKGQTDKSVELFRIMPEKDNVAWTAVISGFVSNEMYEEAFCWFTEMLQKSVKPNSLTLSSLLSASANLAILTQGQQIHGQAIKMYLEFDLSIQNSLVSMYSKCGNVSDACQVFMSIKEPNIISFNSMITGFAQNGFSEEALKLFRKMQSEGPEPNQITFLAVLSACTHVGLVEVGWEYFKSMKSLYNMEPTPDHYACMVDLLGRAGLFDEAVDLIYSMPFEPHTGVWGALLGASRTHLRVDLAKLAAQQLKKLDPDNATSYVVLSNLYSILGKKKDGDQVRMDKKSKGIKKSPGCSWVIVKDKVHLFLAGDQSHKDSEEIRVTLWTIVKEMEELELTCNLQVTQYVKEVLFQPLKYVEQFVIQINHCHDNKLYLCYHYQSHPQL
ncbi:pentatricopeptide repeat-containing protein At1g53600, mitochondrial isoform X2 [Herrania umbratica]|uniref:Pentatricopeptide repeat-containing protein At1g53600, mitochondrial isoform X2 n=1 Tax=Herrania umbratica TaxID=108875 RepID=A0A6J1AVZ2_9ROSI|nr:pentatricopeptide repeat-containing protein At1g53600, mitochondrial isoform X2 [Herrania umbratica]